MDKRRCEYSLTIVLWDWAAYLVHSLSFHITHRQLAWSHYLTCLSPSWYCTSSKALAFQTFRKQHQPTRQGEHLVHIPSQACAASKPSTKRSNRRDKKRNGTQRLVEHVYFYHQEQGQFGWLARLVTACRSGRGRFPVPAFKRQRLFFFPFLFRIFFVFVFWTRWSHVALR